jgi:gluconate 2-dehydrogenase gamma chain
MNHPSNPRRRKFLRAATAVAAGGGLASCGGSKNPWRTLSLDEAEVAAAVCDRIIPPDELPGAAGAGAVDFLDRQLSGYLKKYREAYRRGLAGINQSARMAFGQPFAKLAAAQQDEVLKAVEKGKASGEIWKSEPQQAFFAMMVSHTMQSFYGDPRHGGNREGAGWRSIGYDLTIVRGRAQHDLTQIKPVGGKS